MSKVKLNDYLFLIRRFLSNSINEAEFERSYLELFKADETIREERVFLVLDRLFSDVDMFCADSTIRGPDNLDEKGLREAAQVAYKQLNTDVDINDDL